MNQAEESTFSVSSQNTETQTQTHIQRLIIISNMNNMDIFMLAIVFIAVTIM